MSVLDLQDLEVETDREGDEVRGVPSNLSVIASPISLL
jgi:hypothetical protein